MMSELMSAVRSRFPQVARAKDTVVSRFPKVGRVLDVIADRDVRNPENSDQNPIVVVPGAKAVTEPAAVAPTPAPVEAEKPIGEKRCFAHWGEDQVVGFLFKDKPNGFYVDVGCYHPSLYSNTKLLADAGWTGVNVDPNPFMVEQMRNARPNDTTLQLAISDASGSDVEVFIFHDWASSNTASAEFAESIMAAENHGTKDRIRVPCETLANLFDKHCAGRTIDFLNIDVEDLDLRAIAANDWARWRPTLIAIEDFKFDFANPASSGIFRFLTSKQYRMVSRTIYTSFFVAQESSIKF